ncbi:MAG: futalosine hydrolase [Vicinamibacterales bacterium]|nr:futalosine hydrolase [Vicinamibacterales bacterium]
MAADLLVCIATELEGALLRARLTASSGVRVVRMGVGPVNAAHAVTVEILRERPRAIIVCGVGGAYPGSGLAVGDVACASAECYGDLGAASPAGFLDMQALGFPVVEGPPPLYNDLPMSVFPLPRRVRFVTVSTCTGTDAAAVALEARTKGAVENMEGAAVAHVAHLHAIPAGEVRGISNRVTTREVGQWKLQEAARAAQEAVLAWIAQP